LKKYGHHAGFSSSNKEQCIKHNKKRKKPRGGNEPNPSSKRKARGANPGEGGGGTGKTPIGFRETNGENGREGKVANDQGERQKQPQKKKRDPWKKSGCRKARIATKVDVKETYPSWEKLVKKEQRLLSYPQKRVGWWKKEQVRRNREGTAKGGKRGPMKKKKGKWFLLWVGREVSKSQGGGKKKKGICK